MDAAIRANGAAGSSPQEAQKIIELSGSGHRGTGIARGVFLPNGDGWRDAVDFIDIGALHAFQKLARVGGERLDITALPFGVNRIESERRLARPGDAGHYGQLFVRNLQREILEVVDPGAANADTVLLETSHRHGARVRSSTGCEGFFGQGRGYILV